MCLLCCQNAVGKDSEAAGGAGRTVVFAANVAAANTVAELLTEAGLHPLVYHREVSLEQRTAALQEMRSRC
jgi:superfamily II DNA/RNA helicase